MTRVLRYPRLTAAVCTGAILCALGRDFCTGAGQGGWARVLLVITFALLALCVVLMSCRLFVDAYGVGVGFLLRVRRMPWTEIAALGLLSCNSRRRYVYGMYRGATDLINLLHRAPQCGSWGFIAPAGKKLLRALQTHCPFEVDLSPAPPRVRAKKLRAQWHQAAVYAVMMLPAAAVAFATGTAMLLRASALNRLPAMTGMTLCAMALLSVGTTLLYRLFVTINTCPAFSEAGIRAGRGLYLPWDEIHFGYVHRLAQMSGLFLLSQPLDAIHRRGAPPIRCLSMPDTNTLLVAYLMYCPHANKAEPIR